MTWWVEMGYPPFDKGRDGFPRAGQVVKHYREQKKDETGRTWSQKDLARHLKITEHAVRDIERGAVGIDHERRHFLCPLLDIPPVLFGIVTLEEIARRVEQEKTAKTTMLIVPAQLEQEKRVWWVELGYPAFAPGKDGFPRSGEVVKYYRERKMDHKGHSYTQAGLAQTLGITEQSARYLENKAIGMDDFDRRQFLSKWLAIPPILLGVVTRDEIDKLVEQRRAATSGMVIVSTPVSTSRKLLIDVEEYTTLLNGHWTTFINNPAQVSITNIFLCRDTLYRDLPHVRDKQPLQELLCRFHDLVACILRDQQKYDDALVHLDKALQFAQQLNKDELRVLVLYDCGFILWQASRLDKAVQKYEEARRYEGSLPGNLRGSLLLDAGLAKAQGAKTPEEKNAVMAVVDRVGGIVRSKEIEADPYFLRFNLDRYHLTRSESLIAVGRNKEAMNELKLVKGGPEKRRQAYTDILQAQAQINLGEYSEAAYSAASSLLTFQEISSVRHIARIEKIFQQLLKSPYKNSPDVGHLDYLLHYKQM